MATKAPLTRPPDEHTTTSQAETVRGRYRRRPGGWLLIAALVLPLLLAVGGLVAGRDASSGAAASSGPLSSECESLRADIATRLRAEPITFSLGGTDVDEASRTRLLEMGRQLTTCPFAAIEVAGYTDDSGTEAANATVSQRRAESVRSVLVEAGLSGDVVTARGYGAASPVADNATDQGRAANRRVEIHAGTAQEPATSAPTAAS